MEKRCNRVCCLEGKLVVVGWLGGDGGWWWFHVRKCSVGCFQK